MTTHKTYERNQMTNYPKGIRALLGLLVAVIGVMVILSGCEEQPYGVFASIEREQDLPDSELGEDATIFGMVQLGDEYWLSYMRLQRRPVTGGPSNWSNAPHPSGFKSEGDHAVSLVGAPDGSLYAAFRTNNARNWNVFRRSSSNGNWVSLETQAREIMSLVLVRTGTDDDNYELYGAAVSSRTSSGEAAGYQLVQIDTNNGGIAGDAFDTGRYPVRAGVYFAPATGEEYLFFSQSNFYRGPAFNSLERIDSIIADAQAAYIFNDNDPEEPGEKLYISGNGGVVVSSDGRTFSTRSAGRILNGFGEYTADNGVSYLVVGSQDDDRQTRPGNGYYLVAQNAEDSASGAGTRSKPASISGRTGNARGAQNYEGTLLATGHIRDFFVADNRVFALTVGRGLWSASIQSSGELSWRWE